MATDPSLPKDPASAAALVEQLARKDQDLAVCRYPTCYERRRPPEKGGKPPAYCGNPLHTPLRSSRARAEIADLAKGLPSASLETEEPASTATVRSLRDVVLARLEQFQDHLGLYLAAIREVSDPDIASAQIEAANQRANASASVAQETAETERALRLSAEHARTTAQEDAQAARSETTLAVAKMHEAEERARQEREEHERLLAEHQQEHERALETLRLDTKQRIEAISQQAANESAQAQARTATAEEEARQAQVRARDAEVEARARVESVEHRLAEIQRVLRREQDEIGRLRQERDTRETEAQLRAESDRKEIQHLRTELAAAISQARDQTAEDRQEITRLREHLVTVTRRADDLAIANDALHVQLLKSQQRTQKRPKKQE